MNDYPHYQDIIYLNFDPSPGNEVNKRRLDVVISITEYNRLTETVCSLPDYTYEASFWFGESTSFKIDGYVNAKCILLIILKDKWKELASFQPRTLILLFKITNRF